MSVVFFFLFCFILPLEGFIRSIYTHNKLRITMLNQEKNYQYAKEYYDFYQKYKGETNVLQSSHDINYNKFAEKRKERTI